MRYDRATEIILESTSEPLPQRQWRQAQDFAEDVLDDLDALAVAAPLYDWSQRGWA